MRLVQIALEVVIAKEFLFIRRMGLRFRFSWVLLLTFHVFQIVEIAALTASADNRAMVVVVRSGLRSLDLL